MKTRRLGATDLVVSEIGFGCGGNAGLMIRGEPAEQRRIIARALAAGITYFDTAPDYGDGRAEIALGRALKDLQVHPVITTKVEIRAADRDDIAGHIRRSVDESLARLGLDAVDIVQIHNGPVARLPVMAPGYYATLALDDFLKPGGVLEGVRQLLESGKARYSGFICRGNDAAEVRTLLETGLFHLINAPYTLLNPTAGRFRPVRWSGPDHGNVIGAAVAAGAGTAVFSPLAGGLLTDALLSGRQTHPLARAKDIAALEQAGNLEAARRFQTIARETGTDLATLAYRFVLSDPGVTTLLGGFSSADQIDVALAASAAGPLDAACLAAIEAVWSVS